MASSPRQQLEALLARRVLVIDGATGTMLQARQLEEKDYRGDRFAGSSRELKGNSDDDVVIVGDINSAPTDGDVITPGGVIGSPYRQFTTAGYADVWQLRPGKSAGLTCCQLNDLLNAESELFKRVDVILARAVLTDVHATVVGNEPDDRTPSGLWPSDHAGVVARLQFGY